MAGYIIVDIHVTDPDRYEEYKRLAAPTVAEFGGRYLVRGGAAETLEGDRVPDRLVLLEFPSAEQAKAWWHSEQYGRARAIRHECATAEMIVVEGV